MTEPKSWWDVTSEANLDYGLDVVSSEQLAIHDARAKEQYLKMVRDAGFKSPEAYEMHSGFVLLERRAGRLKITNALSKSDYSKVRGELEKMREGLVKVEENSDIPEEITDAFAALRSGYPLLFKI